MSRFLQLARASLLVLSFVVSAATASRAGPLGDFNVLVFGDFTAPSSDVEGRLYAGGNVSLGNYSVGDKLSGGLVDGNSLVVGGNLSFTSGAVYHGDIVVGGSAAGVDSSVRWGTINAGYTLTDNVGFASLPVDFVGEQARLNTASAGFAALAANGSSEYKWSQLFLTGDGTTGTQVFNVTAAQLAAATDIVVNGIVDGVDVIVNVSGSAASMSGGMDAFFERNRDGVLFNFHEADTLGLANIGVQGSILAPGADVTTGWGVVWGQVIAASWDGPMQVNQVYYDGPYPLAPPVGDTPSVPAPATLAVMLFGLGALRRIRRAA